MSTSTPTPPADPTFRTYTSAQATTYALNRHGHPPPSNSSSSSASPQPSYPRPLYDHILTSHTSTRGPHSLLLDIGCGPGNISRDLAPHFTRTIGIDPSSSMISVARNLTLEAESSSSPPPPWSPGSITYLTGDAGTLTTTLAPLGVTPGSASLLIAGMAAHWFPLPQFYTCASELLSPTGTLVLFTCASLYVHPTRTPHAAKVQALFSRLEDEVLGPYALEGNRLSRGLYRELGMPWDVAPNAGFGEEGCGRRVWNEGGGNEGGEFFFGRRESVGRVLGSLETASMVTRWREANCRRREEGRGEEVDCLEWLRGELEGVLLGGEEERGEGRKVEDVELEVGVGVVVLTFKKTAKGKEGDGGN
ncbi:MAG: hypothetical protein Q9160_002844 [Pyrenula sp. 1 TL-2023]